MEKKKAKILVVDDTNINIDILVDFLGDTYTVAVAMNGKSAIKHVKKYDIDLILLDIMMPEMDGYEVCSILKEDEQTRDIPIIFITAKTDEESIEKSFDVGGVDYICKPFKPKELLARVKTHIELKNIQDILHKKNLELEQLCITDELTGLYNRRKLLDILKHEIDRSRRFLNPFGIVMMDIDYFKDVNDNFGHQVGDVVLTEISNLIKSNLREIDSFGRWGGEEFLIILPGTDEKGLTKVTENIREIIETHNFSHVGNKTSSFGITIFNENDSINSLIKKADDALYKAKEKGRNKVVSHFISKELVEH